MASFAMVLSGAPVFMWRWAIQCAVFINNITATFYKKEEVWATPWELNHGEPFQDASIVVPFGCAALVMLKEDEREKFKATCAMLIFIHYALDHPLYTYAFYSPRTKRVLFRQDCIFLPETFPMREARTRMGLHPEGEAFITYRVHQVEGKESFGKWKEDDPLPPYQDHITGFSLVSPPDKTTHTTPERPDEWPRYKPSHPAFGVPSVVDVLQPMWKETKKEVTRSLDDERQDDTDPGEEIDDEDNGSGEDVPPKTRPRRPGRGPQPSALPPPRRPVKDRWFYEPVITSGTALIAQSQHPKGFGERDKGGIVCDMDNKDKSFSKYVGFTKFDENEENLDTTDQSKRFFGTEKLLDDVFVGENLFENCVRDDSPRDDLPVNNSKNEQSQKAIFHASSSHPDSLGLVEPLPKYLEDAVDNENAAWDLQGLVFHDNDLGWCTSTGWGVDYGTNIVFYTPVGSIDPIADEDHASLVEVLSWIRESPIDPKITDYRSSRALKKSKDVKTLMMRVVPPVRRLRPMLGTMLAPRDTVLVPNAKILASKTLIRILKAQESLFKYGTFVPRNDREAELSPEAPRWRSGRTLEWLRLRQAKTFETD